MGVSLLGKMKLYELAKELNLTSKELLDKAKKIGIEVRSHLSGLEEEEIEKLKKEVLEKNYSKKEEKIEVRKDNKKLEKKSKEDGKSKTDSASYRKQKEKPVIIRREVIFFFF